MNNALLSVVFVLLCRSVLSLYFLSIILSVLRFTASISYPFGISKPFMQNERVTAFKNSRRTNSDSLIVRLFLRCAHNRILLVIEHLRWKFSSHFMVFKECLTSYSFDIFKMFFLLQMYIKMFEINMSYFVDK